jgi:hypothetical protein
MHIQILAACNSINIILVAGYRAKGTVDWHRRINLLRSGENKIDSSSEEQP